ncbi:MAG: response regulator transcription factor [Bacteroidia bacterium]|nr:response regulator transcription factor [Bacteroidia bacterium]
MIKIVAVDDNAEYLESIKPIFSPYKDEFDLAYCFSKFEDKYNEEFLLHKIKEIQPDVVLMDYSFALAGLPSDYGLYLVKKILAQNPTQKIMMLVYDSTDSPEDRGEKVRKSFEAGAIAYLGKKEIGSWREAISEVVRGETYVDKYAMKSVLKSLRKEINPNLQLTDRQIEVLVHLAADQSPSEITALIKVDKGEYLTIHGVNFHLRNIRARLGCSTLHGAVAKAIRSKIIE